MHGINIYGDEERTLNKINFKKSRALYTDSKREEKKNYKTFNSKTQVDIESTVSNCAHV